jgi:hypothetical protein
MSIADRGDPARNSTTRSRPASARDRSADARNRGRNGNPAQTAGRVTAQEQDAAPEAFEDTENPSGEGSTASRGFADAEQSRRETPPDRSAEPAFQGEAGAEPGETAAGSGTDNEGFDGFGRTERTPKGENL